VQSKKTLSGVIKMNQYLEIIVRSATIYLVMIVALRLFGKKELSQLNATDVILILLISNSVQNAMVGTNTTLLGGIIAAIALFVINFIFKKITYRFQFFREIIQGKPEILIHDGIVEFETLSKLNITSDELDEAIREHGVSHFKSVKLAMLEIDGNISVLSGVEKLVQTHHKRKINKTLGNINI
jgi:uncharacterized membrane protein YcaP (DUF421 family)